MQLQYLYIGGSKIYSFKMFKILRKEERTNKRTKRDPSNIYSPLSNNKRVKRISYVLKNNACGKTTKETENTL